MKYSVDRIEGDKVVLVGEDGKERVAALEKFGKRPQEGEIYTLGKAGVYRPSAADTKQSKQQANALLQTLLEKNKK